jgi:hypothetical protein
MPKQKTTTTRKAKSKAAEGKKKKGTLRPLLVCALDAR